MAGRAHLSIGEVLSLLQGEFPGVTISKIRFLESQGLVDPERTPSGYRKFYEDDIARLRWVLRQQRDSFLPLKVIRGRLEDQDDEAVIESGESPEGGEGYDGGESVMLEGGPVPGPVVAAGHQKAVAGIVGGRETEVATGVRSSKQADVALSGTAGQLFDAGPPYSAYGARAAGRAFGPKPTADGHRRATQPVTAGRRSPARRAVAIGGEARQGEGTGVHPRGAADLHPSEEAVPDDTLTLEELVRAAGTDPEAIRDLERYGLVTPRMVAGAPYYHPDAVVVARLAEAFAHHGIEARHLRAYKSAAEREAGVIQQIIMPLIKQRNPKAREAAGAAAEELAELGAGLRAALLRSALGGLL